MVAQVKTNTPAPDAILDEDDHVHIATFHYDMARLIEQYFLKASRRSATGKATLFEYACVVNMAIEKAGKAGRPFVTIKGRRGFLRMLASVAGQEELLRVERELQGN